MFNFVTNLLLLGAIASWITYEIRRAAQIVVSALEALGERLPKADTTQNDLDRFIEKTASDQGLTVAEWFAKQEGQDRGNQSHER